MNRKRLYTVIILISLFAWSPWLTRTSAEIRTIDSFNKAWEYVADGCGTYCNGCGALSSRRIPFGVLVKLEYACDMIPEDTPEYHERGTAFVSPFGTVHGLPKP